MKLYPTRTVRASIVAQKARPMTTFRSSCKTSVRFALALYARSRKRKEDFLQISGFDTCLRPQLFHGSVPNDFSFNKKKISTADSRRVRKLMNRKNERAAGRGLVTKKVGNLDSLARIQPIEGLVQKEKRLRRKQREGKKKSPAISAR